MELGFWFCDIAHDAPCNLLWRAIFEDGFPYRLPIIVLSFLFLATTQIVYYSCCIVCPFLICQCYSNPPNWWFVDDEDDDDDELEDKESMTVPRMKEQMKLAVTFDHRIYSEMHQEEGNTVSDSCAICLYNYQPDDQVVRSKQCRHHAFHEDCLAMWLCHNSDCPCCRLHILTLHPKQA